MLVFCGFICVADAVHFTYPDSIVKDLDLEPHEIQQLMKNYLA